MTYNTGITITEMVVSVDKNNNPLTAATFSQSFFVNGFTTSDIVNISLADPINSIFSASFSASTYGINQFELRNLLNTVIYSSDPYNISAVNDTDKTIYIGL